MINYQNLIFLFGGIQDVTKEKNDMYIYQHEKLQWSKIHTTTNSVYDCSPTLKKQSTVSSV
jgi:N-acetylneuraminic acid mutarotase